MPFNNNIPKPTDELKNSQNDLLLNNQSLQAFINTNHADISSTDVGKHKFLQIPEVIAPDPIPTTAGNEGALYTAEGAISTVTELVFRREGNGVSIPFTEGQTLPAAFNSVGWFRLAQGIIVKYGRSALVPGSFAGLASQTISMVGGPVFTGVRHITLSPSLEAVDANRSISVSLERSTVTTTQFDVRYANQSNGFGTIAANQASLFWIAIGLE